MPDMTMCRANYDACHRVGVCHRSPASGTTPSEVRQSWFTNVPIWSDGFCPMFWRSPFREEVPPAGIEPASPTGGAF